MKKACLSTSEVQALDAMVLSYHQKLEAGVRDNELQKRIQEKVEILAYCIPYQDFFLPREECGEFYLYFKPLIPNLIEEFRICRNIPFSCFLFQRIRWKARNFLGEKHKEQATYAAMTLDMEMHEPEMAYTVDSQEKPFPAVSEVPLDPLLLEEEPQLRTLLETIADAPHHPERECTPEAKERFHAYLSSPRSRMGFLLFLLTVVDTLDQEMQQHLAEVFDVDSFYFAQISRWLHENRRARQSQEQEKGMEGRLWMRYVCLGNTLKIEEDPEKRKELEFQLQRCLVRLQKKQMQNRHRIGMSYRELARESGFSLSKIAYTVKAERKQFGDIARSSQCC